MKPPRGLPAPVRKHFNDLVNQLKELNHLHAVDSYQVERAAVLIEEGRRIQASQMTLDPLDDDYKTLANMLSDNTSKLNMCLDKLGASYVRRNPYKKERGRPKKGYEGETQDGANDWEKLLADVPVTGSSRKAN